MRSRHWILAAALALGLSFGPSACASSSPTAGHAQCRGDLCVQIMGTGASVGDVIGYFAPTADLTGRSWRLVLSAYPCDPEGTRACAASAVYPGPLRRGNPPVGGTCTSAQNPLDGTGSARCPTHLAEQLASAGDWRNFFDPSTSLPHVYSADTWLCVSMQFTAPPSPSTHACSEVLA